MTKEQIAVRTLISLLEAWVDKQNRWTGHYEKALNNEYRKAEHAEAHKMHVELDRPFLTSLKRSGYNLAQIMDIIPGNFKTNNEERNVIISELREWATWFYNLGGEQ